MSVLKLKQNGKWMPISVGTQGPRGPAGPGKGDMMASTYDPQGKRTDIFAYADAKYSKPSGGIPKTDLASDVQTSLIKADSALQSVAKSDVGLGNVDNVKQYRASNPPPYPVTSVNGQTGEVTVNVPTVPSTTNILKGDGSGGLVAAVAGTDYAAASHNHDSSYLKLSGGTLTGNLTGKYITGTWLKTTDATALSSAATKICVLDDSGCIYYRTPEQIRSDIGVPAAIQAAIGNAIGGSY